MPLQGGGRPWSYYKYIWFWIVWFSFSPNENHDIWCRYADLQGDLPVLLPTVAAQRKYSQADGRPLLAKFTLNGQIYVPKESLLSKLPMCKSSSTERTHAKKIDSYFSCPRH